jgi:translation initiation factor IF-2
VRGARARPPEAAPTPRLRECCGRYAREVGAPLVVAANTIDTAAGELGHGKLHQQLVQHDVLPEELGGEVPVVGISATKRINLDQLQEALLLQVRHRRART